MILTIAREQLRSQRGYTAALTFIVTAAVGFATFATTMAATKGAANHFADQASGNTSRYAGVAVLIDPGLPQPAGLTDAPATRAEVLANYGSPFLLADLERAIDDANALGTHARADVTTSASITSAEGQPQSAPTVGSWGEITAVWGEPPWAQILADGRAPAKGEVVLSGAAATLAGVAIGDAVLISPAQWPAGATPMPSTTLRVSGIAHDYGPGWRPATAYISQGDLDIIEQLVTATSPDGDPSPLQAYVGWDQPNQNFADQFGKVSERSGEVGIFGSTSPTAWLVAAALILGTVVVTFALGRSQAQDRVRWTATARALGARRSHLLAAAGIEWAVIATTAAAVGIGTGVGAASIAHRAWLDALAAPPPIALTFPGIVAAATVALAAVLSAITVIVPAIAALRVPPTAALKDTAAVDEMEMSRRVSAWPVGILFAIFFVGLLVALAVQTNGSYWALLFLAPATAVTGIATMVEASRVVVRLVGNALASSATPWALQAGLNLKAHPRQAVAIANIQMLSVASIAGWYMANSVNHLMDWSSNSNPFAVSWSFFVQDTAPHPEYLIAGLVIANVLTVIIMWSTKRLTKAERGTVSALGLSGIHSIAADAVAWGASQCAGIVFGWAVGGIGIGAIATAVTMGGGGERSFAEVQAGIGMGLREAVIVAAFSVLVAAVVALLTAFALRPRTSSRPSRHLTSVG